ncbi:hypothetical protein [Nostoc sp. 'Lobaria pulmonaria (5183) cyanobiont']|uniref:hypothetical protein n=1 Tax=Nostoc sp. 'Lobaria pulmonaria (5183) cyanobiont' TaxID=1618022 RepID=UPI001F2CBCBE|nr:hypothetical protein [Nostoc sp. 'Lobaria pulmonaria (5183) cyanobiont']
MLLLVWRLRFCPKRNQKSPDRCGEAISLGGRLRHRSLWGIDIIPSLCSKMSPHRVRLKAPEGGA